MTEPTETEDIIETGADGTAVNAGPYAPVDVAAAVDAEYIDLPVNGAHASADADLVAGTRLTAEQHKVAGLIADGILPDEICEITGISADSMEALLADPGVQAEIGRQVLGAGLAARDEQVKVRKRVLNAQRAELNKRAAAGQFSDMRLADLLKEFRAGLKELRELATGSGNGGGAPGTVNNILVNIQQMTPEQLNDFVKRQTRTMRLIPGGRKS